MSKPEYGVLTYINTADIQPHKDNPRKDIGDVSELAESIKVNGVLQNLTVVPIFGEITGDFNGKYTVVIGHRRLAAAKLAGLETVPCIVSNMAEVKQIRTMLTENMQRTDLTVYEQAQGFQMMLDLGDSVADISERTGFSSATVRRRVKLLELDKDKFLKASSRGASLMDYAELEKIEDIDLRNKVLDSIGTSNFQYELKRAVEKEQSEKARAEFIAILRTFASEVESSSGLCYIRQYYGSLMKDFKTPEDAGDAKYFYKVESWGVTLYKEISEADKAEDAAKKEQQGKLELRQNELRALHNRAKQLRRDFIKGLSNAHAKKCMTSVIQYVLYAFVEEVYACVDAPDFVDILDIPEDENSAMEFEDILPHLLEKPELSLLVAAYENLETNDKYFTWKCEYESCEELDTLYAFMEAIGYEVSDEERSMMNGTHELYAAEETE